MSDDVAKAVVLAAGKGVRMKSERAKVLHSLMGRPILEYPLRSLRQAGIEDILVVVGRQAEQVQKVAAGCRFVVQAEQRGTGHALAVCEQALAGFAGDLLVLPGDAPLIEAETLRRMLREHRVAGRDATFLSGELDDPAGYGRVVRDRQTGGFIRFAEEADASEAEKAVRECNSGAYVFRAPAVFAALRDVKPDNRKGEIYLTDALGILAAAGRPVEACRSACPDEIRGINSRRDLAALSEIIRRRILERHMEAGVTIADPSTTYIEEGVTIGSDTVILPFTVIHSGVTIGRGCEVGPFSRLRSGTVLEDGAEVGNFVEVKNSRLGPHSKAKHLSYLGDAVLGAKVNIGAGTITANYDGVRKHKTVLEDGVHTGANTVLVAPVKVGKGAKTGAGAVVTRGEIPEGALVAGVPARPLRKRDRGGEGA